MKLPSKALIFSIILTFTLFALPYFLPIPNQYSTSYKQKALSEGRYLTIDGYETYITEKNPAAKESIVLIHGFAGNSLQWRSSIDELKDKGYRVIAIDLINFGFSERDNSKPMTHSDQAELIYKILDELDINKATFIGHSMGASVVTHFYNKYPDKVNRLIFVSPAININYKTQEIVETILRLPGLERWLRIFLNLFTTENNMEKFLDKLIINPEIDIDEIKNIYIYYYQFKDWDLGILNANYNHKENQTELKYEKDIPIYVIWGTKDEVVKESDLTKLLDFENVEYIEMGNSGHLPFEDYSDEFNENLLYCIGNQVR